MELLEEKEMQVAAWLKQIFGDHPIPHHSGSPTEILHHLSEPSRVRDRDVYLVIEDLKQKASEYESERISRKQSWICLQKGPKLIIVVRTWTF
uniref:HAUS augmin like complex subunit 1 n=1 Tax=Nomascus leucogenys TaxID=61853 RepID=A0A2I3FRB3_NOMLE